MNVFLGGNTLSKGRNALPSIFFSPLTERDRRTLLVQAGGKGRWRGDLLLAVARRCSSGAPQVVLCRPMSGNNPFPTSFWLTCPRLVKEMALRESEQGTPRMEQYLRDDRERLRQWRRYHVLHVLLRLSLIPEARRRYLRQYRKKLYASLCSVGVGGITYQDRGPFVKCLHLQMASYLALRTHPAAELLTCDGVCRHCCDEG